MITLLAVMSLAAWNQPAPVATGALGAPRPAVTLEDSREQPRPSEAPMRRVIAAGRTTLAAALAAARPGDTLEITAGVFREGPLLVDRPVVIRGIGRPVIEGLGDHTLLHITAPGVIVSGLRLRNARARGSEDRAAIRVESGGGCRLEDNEIEDAQFGITVLRSHGCVVRGNRIVGPDVPDRERGNAIHLWSSDSLTVEDNDVSGHRDGLYLEFVRASRLADNRSHGNRRYGMHFMYSDDCTYENNHFSGNAVGVAVMYTRRVVMTGNRFEASRGPASYGLLLKDINDSRIAGNVFDRNTVGLYLEGSNRQLVASNRFTGNGWAVRVLANASDNRFEGNAFVGNAFDVATNSRSATSRFHGNYWDRYRGYDLDRDGQGDVPYAPVRLFSLIVERHEPALLLLRSVFIDLLDQAERLLPVLTPAALADPAPLMRMPR